MGAPNPDRFKPSSYNNDRFKFRIWDIKFKKFLHADDIRMSPNGLLFHGYEFGEQYYYSNEGFIIKHCTGFRDKNRKLIYEGDILTYYLFQFKIRLGDGTDYIVGEDRTEMGFLEVEPAWNIILDVRKGNYYQTNPSNYEVIGNVLENPELLEEKNDV